jgi:hypothetical protein
LRDSHYLDEKKANELISDAQEIERIVTAILRTAKANRDAKKI